jgi:hypothetical protein
MSVMSTVVLSANSEMTARLETDNLAHLIALSIREAQLRALSATVPVDAVGASSIPGYGMYFSAEGSNQSSVVFFSDTRTGDSVSYYPGYSQGLSSPKIGKGYTISGFSPVNSSGGGTPTQATQSVSIYFHRPRPDATIYYGSSLMPTTRASSVTMTVTSPKAGVTKTITVTSTGQITVE